MPEKVYDPETGLCLVEFRLPVEAGAREAWLVGEFNDWAIDATPLQPDDDGSLVTRVALEPGRSYRFRYYLGAGMWENDWAADAYVPNDHGGADSVVELDPAPNGSTKTAKKAAAKKTTAKKSPAKKAPATKQTAGKRATGTRSAAAKKAAPKQPSDDQ